MQTLLEQLLYRWEQAFDELQTLPAYEALVRTTQYSDGLRYDLEKFGANSFPSNGLMTQDKDSITTSLYEYGFNSDGLPCHVKYRHDYNDVTREGFYAYGDSFVEYVEFCLNTGVPAALTRLEIIKKKGRQLLDALSPIIQFILSVLYPTYTPLHQTILPPQNISTAVYTPSGYSNYPRSIPSAEEQMLHLQ